MKDNIPKGEYEFIDKGAGVYEIWCDGVEIYHGFDEDVALFIFQAFNVFSKTGMTPEELYNDNQGYDLQIEFLTKKIEHIQQQRDKILERFKYARRFLRFEEVDLNYIDEFLNTPQEEKTSKKELSEALYSMIKNFEGTYKKGSAAENSINHAKKLLKYEG